MSRIEAVLIDLDNTLIFEDEAAVDALRRTSEIAAARTGADARVVGDAAAKAAETLFGASPVYGYADAMGIWWGEVLWGDFAGDDPGLRAIRELAPGFRREVWTRGLAAGNVADDQLAGELAETYRTIRRGMAALDPDAETTLAELARDRRLALVTNGAPDVQREKIATARIGRYFAATVISAELGFGKPDPRIFGAALDALDVGPADAVMVGDSVERDVVGARRAGLRCIWVDRAGDAPDARAAARIRRLGELPAAVRTIEAAVTSEQLA